MWRRLGTRFGRSFSKAITSASITTCFAATVITNAEDKTQRIASNRVLSDRHKVALAEWPVIMADMNTDTRVNSLDALVDYLRISGYDGIEMSFENFQSLYFSGDDQSKLSNPEMIRIIKSHFDAANLRIFGILLHSRDGDWSADNVDQYLSDLKESLYWNRQLGVEYVTFQIWLPERYMTGDGSYRNDDSLLKEYIERVKTYKIFVMIRDSTFMWKRMSERSVKINKHLLR
eukprot:312728_1